MYVLIGFPACPASFRFMILWLGARLRRLDADPPVSVAFSACCLQQPARCQAELESVPLGGKVAGPRVNKGDQPGHKRKSPQ